MYYSTSIRVKKNAFLPILEHFKPKPILETSSILLSIFNTTAILCGIYYLWWRILVCDYSHESRPWRTLLAVTADLAKFGLFIQ